jgi:predicted pyridoxine 5'-phosphate oxidase superfamily flavin-nucleotide-binding protein
VATIDGMKHNVEINEQLAELIAAQTSFFLGTASADAQPYIQHRGGPPGFLHVVDAHTLAFADFAGNRQYLSKGNLAENPRVHLFLIDYAHRQRIKIWGTARLVEDDPALLAKLMPPGYKARGERVFLITVTRWDVNCPAHIPQLFPADAVSAALAVRDARIANLEAELAELRGARLG